MQSRQTRIRNTDGHLVFIRCWEPDASSALPPRGVIHISHGMAEHSARYSETAEALVDAGFIVFAHDHRGHGNSINHNDTEGHYSDEDGWNRVISDMDLVGRQIKKRFPSLPLFIFGHSMGSFIVMQYLIKLQPDIAGLIISGSNYSPPLKYIAAARIAKLERLRQGKRGKSALIRQMTFGSFNAGFKPAQTEYEWLSRRRQVADKFINDPQCGFDCSNQLWIDLLGGLYQISLPKNLKLIPAKLPIYMFGGSEDPVSAQGKGMKKLAEMLRKTGHSNISLRIYEQGRHEMLNETNQDEVVDDLLLWLEKFAPGVEEEPSAQRA
jgi:alpha-beta hydrolase superfamily lysophospholipase